MCDMNPKAVAAVAAVLVAAGVGGAHVLGLIPGNNAPTGNVVKEAFELSTGSDLEVMKVEDKGSLNRVVLSDGENVINTHVTNDGQFMVRDFVHLQNFTRTLKAREDFLTCLDDQNAQFFGIMAGNNQQLQQHTRMAQLQIQVLGGTNGLQNIFQGPGTEGFPQQRVLDNGIVWRLNGELSDGMKTIQQLEEATGCTYDAPGT